MKCSQTGLPLTKPFKGCRLEAYHDSRGIWTIGFGHTFGVRLLPSPPEQADAWLVEDVQSAVDSVNRLVKLPHASARWTLWYHLSTIVVVATSPVARCLSF